MGRDTASTEGKLGIVLSGGGARGAFQAGVLEVLLQHPQFKKPEVLSGTSAGAINAAILAKTNDAAELKRFWFDAANDQPIAAHKRFFEEFYASLEKIGCERWYTFAKQRGVFERPFDRRRTAGNLLAAAAEFLLKKDFARLTRAIRDVKQASILEGDSLLERLKRHLGDSVKPREGVDLAVSVVDAHTGEVVRFATQEVHDDEYVHAPEIPIDVIRASASIPVLLPAVLTRDAPRDVTHLCWDGGLLVNTPLSPIVKLGAERAVTVLCTVGPKARAQGFTDLDDALERLADTFFENTYNVDCKLLIARNLITTPAGARALDASDNRKIYLHKAIRPDAAAARSYLDFSPESFTTMYEDGRAQATRWLAEGPLFEEGIVMSNAAHPFGD